MDCTKENIESWKAMEEIYKEKKVGAIQIPKSTKEERIISNVHVDFVMSDEDMEYLDKK